MFYGSSTEGYSLNTNEIALNLDEKEGPYNRSLKMNIPKFMPLISHGIKPLTNKSGLSDGLFINAPDCKITTSKTILTQNFLTIPCFQSTGDFSYKDYHTPTGTFKGCLEQKFLVEIVGQDLRQIRLTDKI